MKTTGFKADNYGMFGGSIPTDREGYSYTTQAGWMGANMNWGPVGSGRGSRAYRLEYCRGLAKQTREAVKAADRALAKWREENP